MGASGSAQQRNALQKAHSWFRRNESRLFAAEIVCIIFLFFLHLFTSTFQVFTAEIVSIVQIMAILPVLVIAVSVAWKGVIPIIICVLGVTLMHNAIILPFYSTPEREEIDFGSTRFVWMRYAPEAVQVAMSTHFFLGVSMVAFSIVIAYRPSLLFTKNRPESLDSTWSRYPVWQDNAVLAGGYTEPSVPVKSLMTDQDRYLLWRYEYVLADIYSAPHLVRPEGFVPKSTTVLRDKESGRVIGKARYSGYFM